MLPSPVTSTLNASVEEVDGSKTASDAIQTPTKVVASPTQQQQHTGEYRKASLEGWGSTTISDRAKMVYDFEAAPGSQEISVSAGDVVEVLERQDDG